jgi:hypothetical protein
VTFTSLQLPAAAVRWRIDGPAGPHLDVLVGALIGAGCDVECIAPATAYRLTGPEPMLQALAAELTGFDGFTLAHEAAPVESVNLRTTITPKHPPRRAVVVHGAGVHAAGFVARAIDAGLTVSTTGLSRWSVAGRGDALVAWLAAAWNKPAEDVMQALGVTPETLAAEDDPVPPVPVVNVVLPDRRIVSKITRNRDGDIVDVEQTETTLQ